MGVGLCFVYGELLEVLLGSWIVGLKRNKTMQCAYKVTSRRVRTIIVAMKKQKLLHILSVCL